MKTAPGAGTTFRLFFPVAPAQDSTGNSLGDRSPAPEGGGLVLIVDDEEIVLNLMKEVLRRNGFDVITATNGLEGMAEYRRYKSCLVAVILDYSMPGLDGREVLVHIRKDNRTLPIILVSALDSKMSVTKAQEMGFSSFLQKPFQPRDLLSEIHRAINT